MPEVLGSYECYYFPALRLEHRAPAFAPVNHRQDAKHTSPGRLHRIDRLLGRASRGDHVLDHDDRIARLKFPSIERPAPWSFASFRTLKPSSTRSLPQLAAAIA